MAFTQTYSVLTTGNQFRVIWTASSGDYFDALPTAAAVAAGITIVAGDSSIQPVAAGATIAFSQAGSHANDRITATLTLPVTFNSDKGSLVVSISAAIVTSHGGSSNPVRSLVSLTNSSTVTNTYTQGEGYSYYLDGMVSGGTDIVGSQTHPFETLTDALSAMDRGDTLYVSGDVFNAFGAITASYIRVLPWAGVNGTQTYRPLLLGAEVVNEDISDGWVSAGSGRYTTNIYGAPDGPNIYGVVCEYGAPAGATSRTTKRVGSDGRFYGHLQKAASASVGTSEWYFDADTGDLTIKLSDGSDPTSKLVYIAIDEGSYGIGLKVTGSNNTASGIDFALYMKTGAASGNGGQMVGSNNIFIDCRAFDTAYHPLSHQDGTTANCYFINCESHGIYSANNTDTPGSFVFHATDGSTMANCVAYNCRKYDHAPTMEDGVTGITALDGTSNYFLGGFYTHAGTGTIPAGAVTWRNCSVTNDAVGCRSNPFDCGSGTTPADLSNKTLFSAVSEDCRVTLGGHISCTTAVFHDRPIFDLTKASTEHTANFQQAILLQSGQKLAIRSGVILVDNGGTYHASVFKINHATAALWLAHCTVLELGAGTSKICYFFGFAGTAGTLTAKGCIIDRPNCTTANMVKLLDSDSSATITMSDNWYPRSATAIGSGYSSNTSKDSQAEFAATIDTSTASVYATTPAMNDATGVPTRGGNLYTTRGITDPRGFLGVNRTPVIGNFGAYQRGGHSGLLSPSHPSGDTTTTGPL